MNDQTVTRGLLDPALLAQAIQIVAPDMAGPAATMWAGALAAPLAHADVNTERRLAAFLGQVAYESERFTRLEENLNYSAERMVQVWPDHFANGESPEDFDHDPEALANFIYADRLGNGDEDSGDGWTFRGAGLIQLTGRANHTAWARTLGMFPEAAAAFARTPQGAAQAACWFWSTKALNAGADVWLIQRVTRLVNGGLNGLRDRQLLCGAALKFLLRHH